MLDIIEAFEAELAGGATTLEREPGAIPLRAWLDLAERLRLRVRLIGSRLVFDKLDDAAVLQTAGDYSADSAFAQVNKLDDPRFVLDLREALDRVLAATRARESAAHDRELATPMRVLDLGVHRGDELVLVERYLPGASIVAVDRDASALAIARSRFPRVQFVEADVMTLPGDIPVENGPFDTGRPDTGRPDTGRPDRGRFDLVIAIGLLQSAALDDRELLRRIVQQHLAPDGAIILGIPNCRYIAGEIEYGARMRNFTQPELGLVIKDVAFYRKYLQQHHRQVFVTGKHYLFVTGITQAE